MEQQPHFAPIREGKYKPVKHWDGPIFAKIPGVKQRKFPAIKSALHLKIGPPQKRAVVTPAYNAE